MNKVCKSALPGERFGRLVVIGIVEGKKRKCICDCGKESIVSQCNLATGNTQSCGCLRREIEPVASLTHGHSSGGKWSRVYTIYHGIIARCTNPNNPRFKDYGGRDITMCEEWRNSFEAFLSDMGEPPEGFSIDRVDHNGPYEKDNCVWATSTQQNRNKRSSRLLTHNGITQSLAAWAEQLSIPYLTLHSRLKRGWTVERTLSEAAHV